MYPDVKLWLRSCGTWCVCAWVCVGVCVCVNICRSSVMQAVAISSRGNMKFPVLQQLCSNCPVLYLREEGFEVSFPSARHRCDAHMKFQCVSAHEGLVWTHILTHIDSAVHSVAMQWRPLNLITFAHILSETLYYFPGVGLIGSYILSYLILKDSICIAYDEGEVHELSCSGVGRLVDQRAAVQRTGGLTRK